MPFNLPDGSVVTHLDRPDVASFWEQQGLPSVAECPQAYEVWLPLDAEDWYASVCGSPSCYTSSGGACSWACARKYVMFYPGHSWVIDHTESHEQAHELMHMWSYCTLGTADPDHSNSRIWIDVMRAFP